MSSDLLLLHLDVVPYMHQLTAAAEKEPFVHVVRGVVAGLVIERFVALEESTEYLAQEKVKAPK